MPVIPKTFKEEGRFETNPLDLFITPRKFCDAFLTTSIFDHVVPHKVLDPGCGTGVWGEACRAKWPNADITGVDLQNYGTITERTSAPYDRFIEADYIWSKAFDDFIKDEKFDLIIGNPPYSSETDRRLAEKFIYKSMDLLEEDGILCFLLKTEFLASRVRFDNLWRCYPPSYIHQSVERINWRKSGSNTIEYAMFTWYKANCGCIDDDIHPPLLRWLSWKGDKVEER